MSENWYALYTKPRWERKVAKQLEDAGFQVYCPTVTEIRQWSDRKKKVTTPLFKSYVFVKVSEKQRPEVFAASGVVQYIYWLGKPAVIRDSEIEVIQKWLNDETVEEIEIASLSPGDQVTISKGSFKGKEAIVSKIGKKRLRLILKSLGCVVNVRVNEVLDEFPHK